MRIVFMGTPGAAASSLKRLLEDGHEIVGVYTQPDRPAGRGNKVAQSAVKEFALGQSLNVLQPVKIKTSEALEEFRSLNADMAVVVAYGRILPEGFLDAFPKGAINLHFSLLPKYRGAAPVNWAIANGETHTGVTTIKMDAGLDTGDILLSRQVDIGERETAVELMERLSEIGASLLSETIGRIEIITPTQQDHEDATFAPIMKREDGLIDWGLSSSAISNRVRGFQPFPGTYTYLNRRKVGIWSAYPVEFPAERPAAAGEIVHIGRDMLIVAAGGNTHLGIEEVQFEGRRRMNVREALNGITASVGDRFSPAAETAV